MLGEAKAIGRSSFEPDWRTREQRRGSTPDPVPDGHESAWVPRGDLDLAPHVVRVIHEQRREARIRPPRTRVDDGRDDEVIMQAEGRAADEFTVAPRHVSPAHGPVARDPTSRCRAVMPASQGMPGERRRIGGSAFHRHSSQEQQDCSDCPRLRR